MEEEIRALLLADSGVSGHAGTRVSFGAHPQGQPFPGVVLNTISGMDDLTAGGPSGLSESRIQVDCYAETYGAAKLLSRAVKTALSGYSGGGLQGVFHASTRDGREGGTNEAERPFRVSMDFMVQFNEN